MAPIMAILIIILMIVVRENISYLNTRSSSIGFSVVSSRMTKAIRAIIAITSDEITVPLDQPSYPASLNPYNRNPNPIDEKINPRKSNLGFVLSVTSLSHTKQRMISRVPIGITISNNSLQE